MLHAQLPKVLVVVSNTEACDDGPDAPAFKCLLFPQCHGGLHEEGNENADKEEMKRLITL